MRHPGRTRPFRAPDGSVLPGSIAEIRYLTLGGVDQWVMIRGESVANPPLLLLHGGPGWSETGFFRHCNAPLERAFTVVYWDQRGAGKSYDRAIPRESMTVERFVADLDELVEAVRARVGAPRVAILGHSWGTVLGALYAARFPEKVAVYVGCAQIGDWMAGEAASYAWALAEAERRGNARVARALREIGPPPYRGGADDVMRERTLVTRLEGQLRLGTLRDLARFLLGGPEASIVDLPNLLRGFRFSLRAMWDEVSRLDLGRLVPALRMPVLILHGRRDHWVPAEVTMAYVDALQAPSKRVVWFEESGHEPFADEAAKFNATMLELVRPLVG